jgi:hypothetical protein
MVRWTNEMHSERGQRRLLRVVQAAHDDGELVHDFEVCQYMHAMGALDCDCCDPYPWRRRLLMPFQPGQGKVKALELDAQLGGVDDVWG